MQRLRRFAEERQVHVIIVAHPTKVRAVWTVRCGVRNDVHVDLCK